MQKFKKFYNKQSISTRILISVVLNFLIVLLVIDIVLYFLFRSIKNDQTDATSGFFNEYNQFSLNQTIQQTKQLFNAAMDSRAVYINLFRAFLLKYNQTNVDNYPIQDCIILNENTTEEQTGSGCWFSKQNDSIFNQTTLSNLDKLLESSWKLQLSDNTKRVKRINIILQNKNDSEDVFVKTIPRDPDFVIRSLHRIDRNMDRIGDGIMFMSPYYRDYRSRANKTIQLIALRCKIQMLDYDIIVQLQLFSRFYTIPVSRALLSNQSTVVFLDVDTDDESEYKYFASSQPMNPLLNYSGLLKEGFKVTTLGNGEVIYSYTKSVSSMYWAGRFNGNRYEPINQDYVYIIHSPSISLKMEERVSGWIKMLQSVNLNILTVLTVIIIGVFFTIIGFSVQEIREAFQFFRDVIGKYLKNPQKFVQIIKMLHLTSFRWHAFNNVLRSVSNVIKGIQLKKAKGRKQRRNDKQRSGFPLNLLEGGFVQRYLIQDEVRFQELYGKILEERKKRAN